MKNNTKIIIGIIAGVLCLVLAGGAVAFKIHNSPEHVLLSAVNTLSKELKETERDKDDAPDMDTLLQIYSTGEYKADYNITMKNEYFDKDTTLEGNCEYDTSEKQMKSSNTVSLDGTQTTRMDYYVNQDKMYMLYPDWFEGSFVIPVEQYSSNLFVEPSTEIADAAGFSKGFAGNVTDFVKDASIETLKEEKGSYRVTIPQSTVNEVLNTDLEVQSDLILIIKVEDNKYVTEITNDATPLQIADIGTMTINISFQRADKKLTAVELVTKMDKAEVDYVYQYTDGNCDIKLEYEEGGQNTQLSFQGKLTGEEDKIKMNIDGLRIHVDDELIMSVDGLVTLSALDQSITKPETEPEYDIMNMTQEDYRKLFTQLGDKIYNLF